MSENPSTPTPAPAPVSSPAPIPTPVETLQAIAPLSAEAALMLQQFSLLDPKREGVGLNTLRPFYKRVGWDVIFSIVHELEAANRLSKRAVPNPKGGVGYHVYTWQEG